MAFQKGQSGNPGGRPKKSDEQIKFERKCREYLDTLGFDKIKRWADSNDNAKFKWAMEQMLEYGFLRNPTVVDTTVRDESAATPEEITGDLAELIRAAETSSKPVDSPPQVEPGK